MEGTVLIIGGAGVFGSRLAEGLVRDGVTRVVVAGRSEGPVREVAERLNCGWAVLDARCDDLAGRFREMRPFAVIDAAGPFQGYSDGDPYRVARAAIAAGAHYLDLSDDAGFCAGIAALDGNARSAGVAALSGVSSVPALSAAAVRAMADGLKRIDLIDTVILPGNRAPRGRSVMAAILSQAGKPLGSTGKWGWIGSEPVQVEAGGKRLDRLAAPIGAPDLVLMPKRFGADDVRFRAGLELPVLHRALGGLAWAVRAGVVRSALPFLGAAHRVTQLFEPLGTDVGAMRVLVRGETEAGDLVERVWTLVAKAGDGPHVPAVPGRVLVARLIRGEVAPGARACLDDLPLAECETGAPERALCFSREDRAFQPLFPEILGKRFDGLPAPVRDLHRVVGKTLWRGEAEVSRGTSSLAGWVARIFRFPPATARASVQVEMVRHEKREVWTRDFDGHRFVSVLSADEDRPGRMWERFGPFIFAIDFEADAEGLSYPVNAGRLLGLPIPRALLPGSETREAVDAEGRVTFDVALSLPVVGKVVRYRGWLEPDQPMSGDQELPAS